MPAIDVVLVISHKPGLAPKLSPARASEVTQRAAPVAQISRVIVRMILVLM
jgi:hypothetical protein